ncbi:MAG: hypothetical protein V1743_07340 [Nanoarchaeota archaeon]
MPKKSKSKKPKLKKVKAVRKVKKAKVMRKAMKKAVKKAKIKKPMKKIVKKKAVKKAKKPKLMKKSAKPMKLKMPLQKKAVLPVQEAMPEPVGRITHYYDHIQVAVVEVLRQIKVGDRIRIKGHTTDFEMTVHSMQIEHESIPEAKKGDDIGMKVTGPVKEHDLIYKV